MAKGAKVKTSGEAFLIIRDKDGNIKGDYVVADGVSIRCAGGNKTAGKPIKAKYFAEQKEFEELVTTGKIVAAPKLEAKK
jgi:hypothetical protein